MKKKNKNKLVVDYQRLQISTTTEKLSCLVQTGDLPRLLCSVQPK
jgi:hypothetical protein